VNALKKWNERLRYVSCGIGFAALAYLGYDATLGFISGEGSSLFSFGAVLILGLGGALAALSARRIIAAEPGVVFAAILGGAVVIAGASLSFEHEFHVAVAAAMFLGRRVFSDVRELVQNRLSPNIPLSEPN